ncbi:unnamed protein product [Enterobius vermicularis]|uniref:Uncharacterized protein n=1 Tax=Enterobius vermicularis TaxID=51028 RepID=A0A0N4VK31_ENTVE|nr:unnamed protein product [Enterobius vermicularis]
MKTAVFFTAALFFLGSLIALPVHGIYLSNIDPSRLQQFFSDRISWQPRMRRYRKWTPLEPSVRFYGGNVPDPYYYAAF